LGLLPKRDFQNIRNALKAREDQVRRLESLRMHSDKEKERHRKIAEYRSEIIFLREHLEGPEDKRFKGLKQDWEEIEKKLAMKECPLGELSAFDDGKKRIIEEYLPEFERVTNEIELLLQRYGEEHESDK
jgi:Mg2+ and Co2+ transporter CorA